LERTGVYWTPVANLLEGLVEILVVNAQQMKAVPGRNTEVKDVKWIANLLPHGLLRGSVVPPTPPRELRDLTRHRRTRVAERARSVNRRQKGLEDANITWAAVARDSAGVSARAMLQALLDGETAPRALAELARGRMRTTRERLEQARAGRMRAQHAFMIIEPVRHLDHRDDAVAYCTTELGARLTAAAAELNLWDAIPGISRRAAEVILAEIGREMRRFPNAKPLASWGGMCPGTDERAGKRKNGKTRQGSHWRRQVLIEAAHGAAHTQQTSRGVLYRRMTARRGRRRCS
jgi:transposase